MEPHIQYVKTALDARMKVTPKGYPFWYARDVMEILAYENWENFVKVIEKAKVACDNSGRFSSKHFLETKEMVEIGSGAKRKRENVVLSRYASYLVAMNGDPSKPEVSTAQDVLRGTNSPTRNPTIPDGAAKKTTYTGSRQRCQQEAFWGRESSWCEAVWNILRCRPQGSVRRARAR